MSDTVCFICENELTVNDFVVVKRKGIISLDAFLDTRATRVPVRDAYQTHAYRLLHAMTGFT